MSTKEILMTKRGYFDFEIDWQILYVYAYGNKKIMSLTKLTLVYKVPV